MNKIFTLIISVMMIQVCQAAQMSEADQLAYATRLSLQTHAAQTAEQAQLARALQLSQEACSPKVSIANNDVKKRIQTLAAHNNITLILGGADKEKHIIVYQNEHRDELVVGLTTVPMGPADQKTLFLNFNNKNDMGMLVPLAGKVGKILLDFSTFKFVKWDRDIIRSIFNLLKPGGTFVLDGLLYNGGANYIDGIYCTDCEKGEIQYLDIPEFDSQADQPFYYICAKHQRPFFALDDVAKVLGFSTANDLQKALAPFRQNHDLKTKYGAYKRELNKIMTQSQMMVNGDILRSVGFVVTPKYDQPYPIKNPAAPGKVSYILAKKPS